MTNTKKLNEDIKKFPQVHPISPEMTKTFEGIQRLIMLDRYAFKDTKKETLAKGDLVVFTIKQDPNFPARAIGYINEVLQNGKVIIEVEDAYVHYLEDEIDRNHGLVTVDLSVVDKPLEIYYEQIAKRNAKGLASVEDAGKREEVEKAFYDQLSDLKFVPAGRVLYGAGSEIDVTFFNCYVMPMPKDSREGIGNHRNEVMEIMSRGGGK